MNKKIAVAYARYSTEHQREESIDAQIRAIDEFAKEEGLTIIEYYVDEAQSARTLDRPQFQMMMKDVSSGMFDYIIVHKLDRFSRDKINSALARNELRNHGVELLSVMERFDGSPSSLMMETIAETMAEIYSLNLSREVKKGHKENALKALHNGGYAPFGYNVNENMEYYINDNEAKAVRYVFDSYIRGKTYKEIIDWLQRNNYKTRRGNDFKNTSLIAMLKNKSYYGVYTYGERKRAIINGKHMMKPQTETDEIIIIEDGMPAIIDKSTFEEAQKRMDLNRHVGKGNIGKNDYLFTGILVCGKCGSVMHGESKGEGRDPVYRCSGKKSKKTDCDQQDINKYQAEDSIIEYLVTNVYTDDFIDDILKVIEEEIEKYDKTSNVMAHLENQKASVDKKLENITKAVMDGLYNKTMNNKMKELEDEKEQIEIEIRKTQLRDKYLLDSDKVREFLSTGKKLKELSMGEQKILLRTLVSKVTFEGFDKPYPLVVDLRVSPSQRNRGENNSGRGI